MVLVWKVDHLSHLGTYDDADIIGVSPTKFSNTESDDDCVNVDTNMLNALSKIIQLNMDKYDSLYNPLKLHVNFLKITEILQLNL